MAADSEADLLAELEAAFEDEGEQEVGSYERADDEQDESGAAEPHAKRQRQEASPAAGAEQQAASSSQAQAASLLGLSDPLLLRVLACLAPEDLLSASRACRALTAACSDGALWRRLYHTRWPDGPQQEEAEHVQASSWLRLYLERDAQAVLEARDAAPSQELLPIYLQMATARRSEALSMADAKALFRSPARNNRSLALASKVEAFRRQHNLQDARHHATHTCGKDGNCRWSQLDSTAWICETSGYVHVCDANCTFRELDPSNEVQVCRVSGRCFAAEMLTEREEHAGDEERGQSRSGRGEEEEWLDEGVSGRLGRAFVEGYNMPDSRAFLRRFGVGV